MKKESATLSIRIGKQMADFIADLAQAGGQTRNAVAGQLLQSAIKRDLQDDKNLETIFKKIIESSPEEAARRIDLLAAKIDELSATANEKTDVSQVTILATYALVRGLSLSKATPEKVLREVEEKIEKKYLSGLTIYQKLESAAAEI